MHDSCIELRGRKAPLARSLHPRFVVSSGFSVECVNGKPTGWLRLVRPIVYDVPMTYTPNTIPAAALTREHFAVAMTMATVPFVPLTRFQRADLICARFDRSFDQQYSAYLDSLEPDAIAVDDAEYGDAYLAWADATAPAESFPSLSYDPHPGNPENY